ncbi:DUF7521 family protein [Halomicrobium salinisoli]|uniref:DUF7521 family protein n=1 Tax=Halomicrobium salinisoli TaxID=2878391 RepID=UPI001CF028D3|nr:hypothetical protein [Halomicrobium salinisoli]
MPPCGTAATTGGSEARDDAVTRTRRDAQSSAGATVGAATRRPATGIGVRTVISHVSGAEIAVAATKTLTLVLGGLITYHSYRAYRRTAARQLGALALGFAIVTAGAVLGGTFHLVVSRYMDVPLTVPILFESALTATGLTVVLYSLYVRR